MPASSGWTWNSALFGGAFGSFGRFMVSTAWGAFSFFESALGADDGGEGLFSSLLGGRDESGTAPGGNSSPCRTTIGDDPAGASEMTISWAQDAWAVSKAATIVHKLNQQKRLTVAVCSGVSKEA